MFVVGVSGVARSGKNLFCDLIIEELAKQGYSAKQFALANALKRDCSNFLETYWFRCIHHVGLTVDSEPVLGKR